MFTTYYIGWASVTNPAGLLNLVWRVRPSQRGHNGYYSINLFLSDPTKHQVALTRDCSGHLPHVIMSRPTISTDNGHHQGWLKELNFLKTPTVSFIRRIYIYIFYLSLKYFTSAEFWGQRTFAHFDIVGWRLCNLSSCKGIPTVLIRAMEDERSYLTTQWRRDVNKSNHCDGSFLCWT